MALARIAVERAFEVELPDLCLSEAEELAIAQVPWAACIGIHLAGEDALAEQDRAEIQGRLKGRLPYVQVWGAKLVIGFKVNGAGDEDREMVDDFAFRVAERLGRWPHGVGVSRIEYANSNDLFPQD